MLKHYLTMIVLRTVFITILQSKTKGGYEKSAVYVLHCHLKVYTALMAHKLIVADLGHEIIFFSIFQLFLY